MSFYTVIDIVFSNARSQSVCHCMTGLRAPWGCLRIKTEINCIKDILKVKY